MLDLAGFVGVYRPDSVELELELQQLDRARRRADAGFALASGAFFTLMLFIGFLGWLA